MAKMGRPPIEINQQIFENLCAIQCTEREICDWFGCCEDTLNKWCKETYQDENGNPMTFSDTFKQKRGRGKISLRRNQWKLSEHSAAMAIFLGKQYLGQTETAVANVKIQEAEDDPLTKALKELAVELDGNK